MKCKICGVQAASGNVVHPECLEELVAENERLMKENKKIVGDYMALMQDVRKLDACEICGWHDADGRCHRPHGLKNCFGWRGRERARFWET